MAVPKTGYSQLNVAVENDLLRRAWTFAAAEGMRKQDLVSAALREYLDRHQKKRKPV
jgi:hypothetical protein